MSPNNSNNSNDDRRVLVRQLGYDTTQNTIQRYFTQFGHVREVIMKVNDRGRSKGFCFVVFGDTRTVGRVLEQGNHVIDDKPVQVVRAGCMDSSNKTCKLFCGGLPHGLSEDRLRQYFATFGEISSFEFIYDKDTATRKHFCFIIFVEPEAVERIVEGKLPPHSVIHHIGKYRVECKKKFEENHPIQRRIKQQKRSENSNHVDANNFNNSNANTLMASHHHHHHHHGKRYPPPQQQPQGVAVPPAPHVVPAQTTYAVYNQNLQNVAPYYNTTYQTATNASYPSIPLHNSSNSSYAPVHPAPSFPQTQAPVNPTFTPTPTSVNPSYPSAQHLANPSYAPAQPTPTSYRPAQQPTTNPSYVPAQQPTTNPSYAPAQQPTTNPSYAPAQQPTTNPSYAPAQQPSVNPPYVQNQTFLNPSYILPSTTTYIAGTPIPNTSHVPATSNLPASQILPSFVHQSYDQSSASSTTTYVANTPYTAPAAPSATTYTNYKAPTEPVPTSFATTYHTLPKAVTTTYHDENRKGGGPIKRGSSSVPRGTYKPY